MVPSCSKPPQRWGALHLSAALRLERLGTRLPVSLSVFDDPEPFETPAARWNHATAAACQARARELGLAVTGDQQAIRPRRRSYSHATLCIFYSGSLR
jgi:hypothetical protein